MDEDIAKSNQRNFRRMVLSAKASYGALSLIVAVCDNPRYRDELIESYEAELSAEGVDCLRVTIDRNEPSLKQALSELVEENGEFWERHCIVTAIGGDELLNVRLNAEKSEQERFAYSLQWTRESFRRFKAPIVIWMDSSMVAMISGQAKDFWSWRTGPFEFEREIEYQPIDQLQEFKPSKYSDESTADPFELEQQIKVLWVDDLSSPLLPSLYQSLGIAYQKRTEQGKAIDYVQEQQLGIEALEKAIELQEPLGKKIELATSLNNLALLYESMGQYDRALPLYEDALEIRKSELGDRHPDTAASLNNLALLYYSMGQYDRALPLYEDALEICKSELGDRHPSTATSLNNLAGLYSSMGQYDRALPLFEDAVDILEEVLGSEHPNTKAGQENLRSLREKMDDEQADTATSMNDLANLYYSMGKYEQALPLYEQVLGIKQIELGDHHSDTAMSLNDLANLHYSMGKYDKALPLYEQAVDIFEEILGSEHEHTKILKTNFQSARQKVYLVKENAILQALPLLEKALGSTHPITQAKRQELSQLRERMMN